MIIAIVLAVGAVVLIVRPSFAWLLALGATCFAVLVTLYGLTVTLGSSRTGDVAYHIAVLILLVIILALLLVPPGRRS